MAYRRYARRYGRHILRGAMGAAGYLARGAAYSAGRGLVNRARNLFRRNKKGSYRRRRARVGRKFLRSIGVTDNRYASLVHRGFTVHPGATNRTLTDIGYWVMNDPRDPCNGEWSPTWDKTANGFVHMASMYERFQVTYATLRVRVRSNELFNLQAATGGTSTYGTVATNRTFKFGLMLSDGVDMVSENISSWDTAAMRDYPIATYVHCLTEPNRYVTLKVRFALKKWLYTRSDAAAFTEYTGTKTVSPTKKVYALLWMQTADKVNDTPVVDSWAIEWTLVMKTKFTDLTSPEDDMGPSTIPT